MIKTPLPDDVFARWLQKQDKSKIEKSFGRKSTEISPMEVVGKEIHKSPALIFTTEISAKSIQVKDKNEPQSYKKVMKEKFYKFDRTVTKDQWKGDEVVHPLSKLSEKPCSRCKGSGMDTCSNCEGKGKHTCDNCKKDKDLQCRNCDGRGAIEFEIEVYNHENKKEKVKKSVNCPECHGKKKFACEVCGDTKVVGCRKCKGSGGNNCKQCEGTGVEYLMPLAPVPFQTSSQVHWHWNKSIEKEMSKTKTMKNMDLIDLLSKSKVEPIKVTSLKELHQKHLEDKLGFWDKEASNQVNDAKKNFESLEKDKATKPKLPIEIYPLQKIDIDTYKGKKFSIYSIGSDSGYVVFDLGF